jgi:hypothetical protein
VSWPTTLRVDRRHVRRRLTAGEHGVAVDALAGDTVQPLGDVRPLDLQRRRRTGPGLDSGAGVAEAVAGKLITEARDVEEDLLAHQAGLVEGDQAVAVGVVADAVNGLELDQRHAAAGLLVDDFDHVRRAGRRGSRMRRTEQQRKAKRDGEVSLHRPLPGLE